MKWKWFYDNRVFYAVCVRDTISKSLYKVEVRSGFFVRNPGVRLTKLAGDGVSKGAVGHVTMRSRLLIGEQLEAYFLGDPGTRFKTSWISLLTTEESAARTAFKLHDLVRMDVRFKEATDALTLELMTHSQVY